MILVLVRKLFRDTRTALIVIALLLGTFQFLWATITGRILGQLAPFFHTLGSLGGLTPKDIENVLFEGPGKIVRTLIGGETINLNGAMDMLSIGFVHPLVQTILCIWAVGRASSAVAGELDRGTMELLMSQPMSRSKVIQAHLVVDWITIPIICLAIWLGAAWGAHSISPIQIEKPKLNKKPTPGFIVQIGPFKLGIPSAQGKAQQETEADLRKRLEVRPQDYWPALLAVAGLLFAVSGTTMLISSMGRSRWRALGYSVFIVLIQFLVNLVGQMWEVMRPLRPLTIFYYYQPQQMILHQGWCVTWKEWNGGEPLVQVPMLLVLFGIGAVGYLLSWRIFTRRDLPAPL